MILTLFPHSHRPEREKKSKREKRKSTKVFTPKKQDLSGFDMAFESETFDEKAYSASLFQSQDKDKVRDATEAKLVASRDLAAKRLQESVHHNYPLFISTSKEISNLEVDMLELRNHLTEVNAVIKGLQNVSLHVSVAPPQQRIRHSGTGESSSVISDIHWLLELPDELDILTSERLFESAVSLVEKAEKMKEKEKGSIAGRYEAVFKSIKDAYDARVQALSASLLKDLQNPALKKTESRTVITFLTRLGFAKTARQIFLETRSRKIRSDVSKLKYDNNTSLFVNELARIVFTAVDSTCDDFQHCFGKDSTMSSGFVVWTIHEMSNILALFRRHIFYSSEVDNFTLVGKCFEITTAHCKTLEQRGLSLTFYLRQTFHKDLVSVINNYYKRMEATFAKQLTEESWDSKSVLALDGKTTLQVTESCRYVESMAIKFISGVVSVWSQELVPTVIFTLVALLDKYVTDISRLLRSQSDLNDRQRLAIVANAFYISNKVTIHLSNTIEQQLKHVPTELADFRKRLAIKVQEMKQHYAFATARSIVTDQLDWEHTTYPMEMIDNDNAAPSPNVVRVFEYLVSTLTVDITNAIGTSEVKEFQTLLFSRIVDEMGVGPFWARESDKEESMFGGDGGLQQFILDIKFCQEACSPFKATDVPDRLKALIDRAILNYCTVKKIFKNIEKMLKDESWERKVIKRAINDFNRKS
jgi:uncharacterized protein YqiB (DUF1249 family)